MAASLCAAICLAALVTLPEYATAAAAEPFAAAAAQNTPAAGSSWRSRALAQAAAPIAAPASAPSAAPAAAPNQQPPGPSGVPNATEIAGGIVGGFNATDAVNRSAIAETPLSDQNRSTSGVSGINPTTSWPLMPNYRAITNNYWRIVGQDVIAKREEMEQDYRLAIERVFNPYNVTVRFLNYTTYPSVTPGLEQFAAVHETVSMYQYVLPSNSSPQLTYGNATSGSGFQLNPQTINLARTTLTGIVQKLGISTNLLALWGEAIQSERARFLSGQFFANESASLQAEIHSRILLVGAGLLPFTEDKQNLLLASVMSIAGQQSTPILSLNVSGWEEAPAARRSRKILQSQDRVYANLWCKLQPVGDITPSSLWKSLLTTYSVFLPTTLANGLAMTGSFVNGTSYYYTQNDTLLGTTLDPSNSEDPFLADGAPTPACASALGSMYMRVVDSGGGGGGGISTGAAIGIAVGIAAAVLLLGLLALCLWRRRSRAAGGEPPVQAAKTVDSMSNPKLAETPLIDSGCRGSTSGKGAAKGSPRGVLNPLGSNPNDSYSSSDAGSGINSTRTPSEVASVPGYAEVDPADIVICLRPSGEPWLLGSGAYGQVYKGVRRGVQQVAVKRLTAVKDPLLLNTIRKEISILQRVSFDRNVVQFYGACLKDAESAMLVMELLEGGDVRHALLGDNGEDFTWYGRGRSIALDVARGLHFLHSSGVIHRDLKTSNILLTKEGVAKIADVGLAKTMISDYFSWETAVGTFAYAAPELLMGSKCSLKADCFSFGVILWELVTRKMPVRGQLQEVQVPEQCPREVEQLIEECITADVAVRPSAAQVVERLLAIPEGRPEDWADGDR